MSDQACFIVHELGRITAIIKGARNAVEPPVGEYLDYTGDIDVTLKHYISDGEPVQIPVQPSISHEFNYQTGQWALDIENGKKDAWERIKISRKSAELATFVWNGNVLQCDEASRQRIQVAVQAAIIDSNAEFVWTLADNSTLALDAAQIKQIGQALSNHISQCHERGRILRAQINAATTQEELEAIVW